MKWLTFYFYDSKKVYLILVENILFDSVRLVIQIVYFPLQRNAKTFAWSYFWPKFDLHHIDALDFIFVEKQASLGFDIV